MLRTICTALPQIPFSVVLVATAVVVMTLAWAMEETKRRNLDE